MDIKWGHVELETAYDHTPVSQIEAEQQKEAENRNTEKRSGLKRSSKHQELLPSVVPGGVRKYWTIQNSWSDTWGEEGRIRLLRTDIDDLKQGGHCGTDYHPEVGLGCKGGSPTACVCGMCGVLFDSVYPVLS
eukprot:3429340-Amphidinium_carterae.1